MSSETEFEFGTKAICVGNNLDKWYMNQVILKILNYIFK